MPTNYTRRLSCNLLNQDVKLPTTNSPTAAADAHKSKMSSINKLSINGENVLVKSGRKSRRMIKRARRFSFESFNNHHLKLAKKKKRKEACIDPFNDDYDVFAHIKKINPLWKEYGFKIEKILRKLRYNRAFIDAFESEGYQYNSLKDSNGDVPEKIKPLVELKKKKEEIILMQKEIKECFSELIEHKNIRSLKNKFVCVICNEKNYCEGNQIILCDFCDCNLGYHQKCCIPPVESREYDEIEQEVKDEEEIDPWFCRRCLIYLRLLDAVCDEFDEDVDSHHDLFKSTNVKQEVEKKLNIFEQLDHTKSKRGRIRKVTNFKRIISELKEEDFGEEDDSDFSVNETVNKDAGIDNSDGDSVNNSGSDNSDSDSDSNSDSDSDSDNESDSSNNGLSSKENNTNQTQ